LIINWWVKAHQFSTKKAGYPVTSASAARTIICKPLDKMIELFKALIPDENHPVLKNPKPMIQYREYR
jgi:hypothetical protein